MFMAFGMEAAAVWLMLISRGNPALFAVMSGIVFFGWGEIFSLFPSTMTDTFGTRYATTNFGFLYIAQGLGSVLGGPAAAWLFVRSGSWFPVFWLIILLDGTTAVLALAALKPMRREWLQRSRVPSPDQLPYPRRRDRQVRNRHLKFPQRVFDRGNDRSGRADGAAFGHAFYAQRIQRRRRFHVVDFDRRNRGCVRQKIIGESRGQRLASGIVAHVLEQRGADPMRDRADDLSLDHQRIDHAAAVVHDDVAEQGDTPGGDIDLDFADMRAVGVGEAGGLKIDAGIRGRAPDCQEAPCPASRRAPRQSQQAKSSTPCMPLPRTFRRRVPALRCSTLSMAEAACNGLSATSLAA